jgi:hypothetical protein
MKQIVKYRILTITGKVTMEIRLTLDDRNNSEFVVMRDGAKYTNLNLNPVIGLSIIRMGEIDDNGNKVRAPWNQNDHLTMTKYNLPILYEELHGIQQDMKKPTLYTYQGNRLELNESMAEEVRRVFMIGNTTIELSAVVIIQPDETRVEGVKMKFNNEQSAVLLTLNELNSLVYNINHIDVDTLTVAMYNAFIEKNKTTNASSSINVDFPLPPTVDIAPKS